MQVVEGYSMFPTLMEGDITITQFTNPNLIEVGDIVVFYSPFKEERIVHRVIEKVVRDDKIYFRTQGDNSHRPDPYKIPGNRIIGKVIFVIPRVGLIRLYISPSTGILLIIFFVILSLLYDYLAWKRKRLSLDFKSPNSKKLNE
jgi:signal peptidase